MVEFNCKSKLVQPTTLCISFRKSYPYDLLLKQFALHGDLNSVESDCVEKSNLQFSSTYYRKQLRQAVYHKNDV